MIEAVWIISGVLAAIALCEKDSRALLFVIGLSVAAELFRDAVIDDRLTQIALKIPIDIAAGFLACMVLPRNPTRWQLVIPALYSVELISHGAFWLARFNYSDIWVIYSYTLNAIFIGRLIALCWPKGGQLFGIVASWIGAHFNIECRIFGPVYEKAIDENFVGNSAFDVRPDCDLYVSKVERI